MVYGSSKEIQSQKFDHSVECFRKKLNLSDQYVFNSFLESLSPKNRSQIDPFEDQLFLDEGQYYVEGLFLGGSFEERNRKLISIILYRDIDEIKEILFLCTHPLFKRKGYMSFLLQSWLKSLKRDNKVWLEVSEMNLSALDLYRKVGFKEIGRRMGYYPSNNIRSESEDAVVMEYKCGAESQAVCF